MEWWDSAVRWLGLPAAIAGAITGSLGTVEALRRLLRLVVEWFAVWRAAPLIKMTFSSVEDARQLPRLVVDVRSGFEATLRIKLHNETWTRLELMSMRIELHDQRGRLARAEIGPRGLLGMHNELALEIPLETDAATARERFRVVRDKDAGKLRVHLLRVVRTRSGLYLADPVKTERFPEKRVDAELMVYGAPL